MDKLKVIGAIFVVLLIISGCSSHGSSDNANSSNNSNSANVTNTTNSNTSSVTKTSKEDLQKLTVGASAVFDNYTITLESFTTDGSTSTAVVRMDSRSTSTLAARYVDAYLADGTKVECNETKSSDLTVNKGESQSVTLTFTTPGTIGKIMWNNWSNEAYWIVNADAIAAAAASKNANTSGISNTSNTAATDTSSTSASTAATPAATTTQEKVEAVQPFVCNTSTGKFHYASCSYVKKMSAANKLEMNDTYTNVLNAGYEPCDKCNPHITYE